MNTQMMLMELHFTSGSWSHLYGLEAIEAGNESHLSPRLHCKTGLSVSWLHRILLSLISIGRMLVSNMVGITMAEDGEDGTRMKD